MIQRMLDNNPNARIVVTGHSMGGTLTDAIVRKLARDTRYYGRIKGLTFNPNTGFNTPACDEPECAAVEHVRVRGDAPSALRSDATQIEGACKGQNQHGIAQFTGQGNCEKQGGVASFFSRGGLSLAGEIRQLIPKAINTVGKGVSWTVGGNKGVTAYNTTKAAIKNTVSYARGHPPKESLNLEKLAWAQLGIGVPASRKAVMDANDAERDNRAQMMKKKNKTKTKQAWERRGGRLQRTAAR